MLMTAKMFSYTCHHFVHTMPELSYKAHDFTVNCKWHLVAQSIFRQTLGHNSPIPKQVGVTGVIVVGNHLHIMHLANRGHDLLKTPSSYRGLSVCLIIAMCEMRVEGDRMRMRE